MKTATRRSSAIPSSITMGMPYVRGGRGQEQAIFHRQKADHLRDRLPSRDHHQEGEQDYGKRDADGVSSDGCGQQSDWLRETKGENDQHQAHKHGDRNVDQPLVIPLGSKPLDQRMKNQRQRDDFQDQCQCCRKVEFGQPCFMSDERCREKQNRALPGKQSDQLLCSPRRQHCEGDQKHSRCEQIQ